MSEELSPAIGDVPRVVAVGEADVRAQNSEAWARVSDGLARMGVVFAEDLYPPPELSTLAEPSVAAPEASMVIPEPVCDSETVALLRREKAMLIRMIEELTEQDIPDADWAWYRKRIADLRDA